MDQNTIFRNIKCINNIMNLGPAAYRALYETETMHESSWEIGQTVKVVGPVQFKGKSGKIADIGRDAKFIVVDIPGAGKVSFHSSDLK
jgi:hypothetical protein